MTQLMSAPTLPDVIPVRLGDICDVANLTARIAGGYIEVKRHYDADLLILDYSRTTQFEQAWDNETMLCRGLMVTTDSSGSYGSDSIVVARGFTKFMNLDQHEAMAAAGLLPPLPDEPFDVFTKADGSLGIGYLAPDGRPAISTRGSFYSDQAKWATEHLRADPAREAAVAAMLTRGTPCFEIISPVSQIVVIYDFTGLVLLGVIDRATGLDVPLGDEWPGRIIQRHDGLGDYHALAELAWPNEEGFVIRFASGVRVKAKFAEYKRLHGLVTGMSTKLLWEHLAVSNARDHGVSVSHSVSRLQVSRPFVEGLYAKSGDPLADILERTPDEFDAWVRQQVADLKAGYQGRQDYYRSLFATLPSGLDKKQMALWLREHMPKDQHKMFALLNGQSIDEGCWSEVRPAFSRAFTVDVDA